MEIECPGCQARYAAPPEAVVPGRAVRCARCGDTWVPVAAPESKPAPESGPVPAEAGPVAAGDVAAAESRLPLVAAADGPAPAPRSALLLAAWVGSAVVLLVLLLVAWHAQARLEKVFPPSARLFAPLGPRR